MVDIVVNNVMANSTKPDYSKYFFKDAVRYFCLLIFSQNPAPNYYFLKVFVSPILSY